MKKTIQVCACGEPWTHTGNHPSPSEPAEIFSGDHHKHADGTFTPKLTTVMLPRIGAFGGPADVSRCASTKIIEITI